MLFVSTVRWRRRQLETDIETIAELADEPDAAINLTPDDATPARIRNSALSIFSFADSFVDNGWNPCDLSRYIDQVSLSNTPLLQVTRLTDVSGADNCTDTLSS